MLCVAMLPLLCGCTLWNRVLHRGGRNPESCTEKPFKGNTDSLPPLKVPQGLSAPDTRNAVKIPDLGPQAREVPKLQPCLALPPSFFSKSPSRTNRKGAPAESAPAAPASPPPAAAPTSAPAPAPAPAPTPTPAPASGEPTYPPGT
ncbi:MAG: hypothetical protein ACRESY_10335 [Steroidobacteraceae bacterium]